MVRAKKAKNKGGLDAKQTVSHRVTCGRAPVPHSPVHDKPCSAGFPRGCWPVPRCSLQPPELLVSVAYTQHAVSFLLQCIRYRAACAANLPALLAQEVELQRLGLADLPGGNATRLVHHNTELGHPRTFATNSVTTAKYNVATFLPRFLFEVFSQVAYFYFLVQVRVDPSHTLPSIAEATPTHVLARSPVDARIRPALELSTHTGQMISSSVAVAPQE